MSSFLFCYLGHYNVPNYCTSDQFIVPNYNSPSTSPVKLIEHDEKHEISDENSSKGESVDVSLHFFCVKQKYSFSIYFLQSVTVEVQTDDEFHILFSYSYFRNWVKHTYRGLNMWINQQDNKGLKITLIILIGCIIAMFWYLQMQVRPKIREILKRLGANWDGLNRYVSFNSCHRTARNLVWMIRLAETVLLRLNQKNCLMAWCASGR